MSYSFTLVTSAAAFRLVWNNEIGDLSNVDIFHTFNESNDIYRLGAEAIGREFSFLGRDKDTTKEQFIELIKMHIDEGYPCTAFVIIGPSEPCIITGYRNNGEELLGRNFFQDDPEFATSIEIDESGYFVRKDWWNNTNTQAVMCMEPIAKEKLLTEKIIANAINAMNGRSDCGYGKGLKAYEAWKKALENEKDFVVDDNYACLYEKMLCQIDAMGCLMDGRSCAVSFFNEWSKITCDSGDYDMIARCFTKCVRLIKEMWSLYGDKSDMDGMLKKLADNDVRKKSCELIEGAAQALELLRKVSQKSNYIKGD